MRTTIIAMLIILWGGSSALAQQEANYDESKVPDYTLPELLVTANGTKITSARDWEKKRRPELLSAFASQMYGRTPDDAGINARYEVLTENPEALQGRATSKQVKFIFSNGKKELEAILLLYLPNKATGKVPVFVGYNYKGNHSTINDTTILYTKNFALVKPANDPDWVRGCQANRWSYDDIINRGYAVATMCYHDIYPDKPGLKDHSVVSLFKGYGEGREAPDEWQAIGAWAWGSSRIADYLLTEKRIDNEKIAIMGHSRQGKAALWAGAQDTRFRIVISNNSGEGGAALSRREYGENIAQVTSIQPAWFCPAFSNYRGKEQERPIDQHQLIALIAPRAVYVASAVEDRWADPKGEYLGAYHAAPVYQLYGLKGLDSVEMPGLNQPIMNDVGYHIRDGIHDVTQYDWLRFMDFADRHMGACGSNRGKPANKRPSNENTPATTDLAGQNLLRAMELADAAVAHYFTGDDMAMARFYDPYTGVRSDEKGSVWMYTAAIESINAILHALKTHRAHGHSAMHDAHFGRYQALLAQLYDNLVYYQGTFELTSFTQTREWTVYGVHRAKAKGKAKVAGIENVYDDQQWLVRELLHSYKLTDEPRYLKEAEYLTEYILDGWDATLDASGRENGGIPWGPGYTTKHACSNGPFVSPLVWLHEHYATSDETITHRYIAPDGKRATKTLKKRDYYLQFATSVYDWQKKHLLTADGVYDDFMGGCGKCEIRYETVDGVRYRADTPLKSPVGPPYSYNSGSPLSGAVDLYRATGNTAYLDDAKQLSDDSFRYFAKPSEQLPGHYEYAVKGFNNWFNGILLRAYVEAYPVYDRVDRYIQTFQQNLDYGYANFLHNGILPTDLLRGWDEGDRKVEGMFAFTFAAEYALLAEYQL